MSAAKHTPGPWMAKLAADGSRDFGIVGGGGCVAECFHEISSKNQGAYKECAANAHLIAAAPDLLAALQGFVNHGTCFGEQDMTAARAAILKATGAAA